MSTSGDQWRPPPTDRFFGPLDRATKRPRFQSNSNIIQPEKLLIVLNRCFIYIRWKVSCHFVMISPKELSFRCSSWTRLANVVGQVLITISEVFKIYTNNLSRLVYNQVYNLFVCTLYPCLINFFFLITLVNLKSFTIL